MRSRLLTRTIRSSLGATLALALLVSLVTALLTAWPRLERQTFTAEVNHSITQTPPTVRALTAQVPNYPLTAQAGLAELQPAVERTLTEAGPELRSAAGGPRVSLTTGPVPMTIPGGGTDAFYAMSVRLRVDHGIDPFITLVEGTSPAPSAWASMGTPEAPVEVMVAVGTAERMELAVGDTFTVPVGSDGYVTSPEARTEFVITGLFDAVDPDAEQWQHQLSTLSPRIDADPNQGEAATAIVYLNPDFTGHIPMFADAELWVPIHPVAERAAGLLSDLRAFTAIDRPLEVRGPYDQPRVRFTTELDEVLESATGRWQSTSTVLAMVAAGPVGVAFAVLALGVRLLVARRSTALALAAARGGAPHQLRAVMAAEGFAFSVPAAAIGAGAAIAAVPAPPLTTVELASDLLLPAAVALAPPVLLALLPLPRLRPHRADQRRGRRWRWVVEAVVVALTAAALWLVLDRGTASTDSGSGTDPLAVTAPLLLAVTVSMVTLRIFPLAARAVHRTARRGRGLTAFLGSARLVRSGGAGLVPLVALAIGVAIAVLATTMLTTLRGGVDDGARAAAGADLRLTGPPFTDADLAAVADLAGVEALSAVTTISSVPLVEDDSSRRVTVYAVDSATLAQVQDQVPGAVELPEGFDRATAAGVPALVWSGHDVDTGGEVRLAMSSSVVLDVRGEPAAASGIANAHPWVMVDLHLLREATGENLVPRDVLIQLAPGAGPGATDAVEQWLDGRGTIASPTEATAEFLASPSARSLQAGFLIALLVSLVLACLAIVLGLLLAAPERRHLLGVLRTLGVSRRTEGRLVAWESVPLVGAAVLAGAGLGLVLPHLVAAAVDLRPFTGSATQPVLRTDVLMVLGVLAILTIVLTLCVLLAGAMARRLSVSVLRIGE
ncbi:ABC transporter permease [Ruania alkalisoli]|uniref:ABC transporter permease n=1 Tax=Ruania alkalisoli TaxID=2779775 RepID=A0A7M1SPQ2_9MICO|nr:ABC transporter permease [Ruania alkalisoli]QOR69529.1 ABC transporter permease [Ruania alkalisoli]